MSKNQTGSDQASKNSQSVQSGKKGAKRYASIDFMRGLAIWMMIFLHTIMRWVDTGYFRDPGNLGDLELFVLFLLVAAVFLGAWAGFFLLVSSIGNMISMQKSIEHGTTAKQIAIKQIVGGIILLIFGMLSESTIGYHGALGILAQHGITESSKAWAVSTILTRWQHYETIHAVAWAVIINGSIHALLSQNDGHKKIKRNMKIYAILAIITIPLTYLAWWIGADFGDGVVGKNNLWELFYLFMLNTLDRSPEPLFPFMAIAFIGNIIGLWMCDDNRDKTLVSRWLKWCLGIFFVGLIGTVYFAFTEGEALDILLTDSWNLPRMSGYGYNTYWLFWFMGISAAQVAAVLLVIRLIEFRGRGQWFADNTTYWRRYGFVAFTIYNYEFFDVPVVLLYTAIPGTPSYNGGNVLFGRWEIWIIIAGVFLFWQLILKLWEKINYAFSLEWMIAKLAGLLIPGRPRKSDKKKPAIEVPWYYSPRLDVESRLLHINALNFVEKTEIDHEHHEDSRVAYKLSLLGVIFFPLAIAAFIISREAEKSEKPNDYLKKAKIVSSIFTAITAIVTIASCFITLNMVGLSGVF